MTYKLKTVDVDVEVDLEEFDDEELLEEVASRGLVSPENTKFLVQQLYEDYTSGSTESFDRHLKELFYQALGRVA